MIVEVRFKYCLTHLFGMENVKEERVWLIEAVAFVRGNVSSIVRDLRDKGFDVSIREVVFDVD